jgi:lysophospholipase L1-like esterase
MRASQTAPGSTLLNLFLAVNFYVMSKIFITPPSHLMRAIFLCSVLGSYAVPGDAWAVTDCSTPTWAGAWNASPASAGPAYPSGADPLVDQTFRAILTPLFSGNRIRVKLSNALGRSSVTMTHVTIAVRDSGAELVPGTVTELLFGDQPSVVMAAGGHVISDELDFTLQPFQEVAVSMHVQLDLTPTNHVEAAQTSYVSSTGDFASEVSGSNFGTSTVSRNYLTAIDVLSPTKVGAIVTLGDSITDGTGSTIDANRRYPDYLARRLLALPAEQQRPVLNAGIGGNTSSAVQGRLDRDVKTLSGASDVILMIGVNDLNTPNTTAEGLIEGWKQLAQSLHELGLRAFISPITPPSNALGNREPERRDIANAWIREHGIEYFDGIFDFDAAVRDPSNPQYVAPEYGGGLHPNDAGHEAMANAVDLDMFTPNCSQRERGGVFDAWTAMWSFMAVLLMRRRRFRAR